MTLEVPGGVDAALVAAVRARPGVAEAEACEVVLARARLGEEWRRLLLFVVDDFGDVQLNRFRPAGGAWPPPAGTMLVERCAVDLAIEDPARPGVHVLGVECDGPAYHLAPTARDRDRLRRQVLEGLGWRLHRIWSWDWRTNPEGEKARLAKAVEEAIAGAHTTAAAPVPTRHAPPPPLPPTAPRPTDVPIASAVEPARPTLEPYRVASLPRSGAGPDDLVNDPRRVLPDRIREVVHVEGPVHQDVILRRVLEAYGVGRSSQRTRAKVLDELTSLSRRNGVLVRGEFVWTSGADPENYTGLRGSSADGTWRSLDSIAPEEIANAAARVLEENLAADEDALMREVARVLGSDRVGRHVATAIGAGVDVLVRRGRALKEGGKVR